jgi:tetratricopeptide (TPR) repeat protein
MRTGLRRALLGTGLLALLLLVPGRPAALGQEGDPNRLHAEGVQLLRQGNGAEAEKKFDEARKVLEARGDAIGAAWMRSWMADAIEAQGRDMEALTIQLEGLAGMRAAKKGPDDAEVAQLLGRLVPRLLRMSRPGEARAHAEAMVAACERSFPAGHPARAFGYNSYAACLSSLGRYGEALAEYEKALELRRKAYRGDHPDTASTLSNVGHALLNLGRPEQALEAHTEALEMFRRLLRGRDHPAVALCLGNLAFVYWALGRPAESLAHHEEAFRMRRRVYRGDHADLVASMNNLAGCLTALGRPSRALALRREALEMARRLHEGDHPLVAFSIEILGSCLRLLGKHDEARELYREALEMNRRLHAGDHRDVARCHHLLSSVLCTLGAPKDAVPHAETAAEMRRRLYHGDHEVVALTLTNLAFCRNLAGEREKALAAGREGLEMARRKKAMETHLCASILARILTSGKAERSELEEAAKLHGEAIAQIEEIRGEATGLEERDRTAYFGFLKRARAFEGMILTQVRLRRPEEALRYLEKSRARSLLDLLERSRFDPLAEAERRAELRGDEAAKKEIADVRAGLRKAESEITRLTHSLGATRGRSDLERDAKRAQVDELDGELQRARESRRALLRERARLLRRFVQSAAPSDPAAMQRLLSKKERMLVYSVSDVGGLLLLVPPAGQRVRSFRLSWPGGGEITEESLSKAVGTYLESMLTEGRRARGLGVPDEPEPATTPHGEVAEMGHRLFRALLPPEVWNEIRKAETIRVVPHGSLHRIPFETLVVRAASTPARTRYWMDEGPGIAYGPSASAMLWCRERRDEQRRGDRLRDVVALGDPVFSRTASEEPEPPAEGVLVVAVKEGSLAEAAGVRAQDVLVRYDGKPVKDAKALRKLVDDAEVELEDEERDSDEVKLTLWRAGKTEEANAKVGRLGVEVAKTSPRDAWKALRAGEAPRTVTRSGRGQRYTALTALPGTRREVDSIRDALARAGEDRWRVTTLLGEEATKPALHRVAPRARILHLATHQLVDETDAASYSCLALTLPRLPTVEDDGFLHLIDLLEHWRDRLSGCELVVLSACETQQGELQRDEGVFAMPWGFHYAGCPGVIASLWRVDDASTAELMGGFYERLAGEDGGETLAAFTKARRDLRKSHPEPYFWAPFIVIGDPR